MESLSIVISVVASHGQTNSGAQGLQLAQHAYRAGMSSVGIEHMNLSFKENWQVELDNALRKLDQLQVLEKKKAINAIASTVSADKKLVTEEHEMLRVISALINVPLPILLQTEK
jgi:hypothetical protein